MQRTAGRQSAPHDSQTASLSNTSVAQNNASVNLFSVRLAPPFFFRHVQIGAEQLAHKAIDGQALALRVGFYIVPSSLGDVDCQSVIAFYIPAILNCRRCFAHRFILYTCASMQFDQSFERIFGYIDDGYTCASMIYCARREKEALEIKRRRNTP